MIKFLSPQVETIAPDRKLDAAQKILDLSLWSNLGCTAHSLWANFQGSEDSPYKLAIEVKNIAQRTSVQDVNWHPDLQYKCTCKSRKQPCKHVLALMLLTDGIGKFTVVDDGDEPYWVQNLLSMEVQDPAAQAKRLEMRLATVLEGTEFLATKLKDILRVGFDRYFEQASFSDLNELANRLVDFQAPMLGKEIKGMDSIRTSSLTDETCLGYLRWFAYISTICNSFKNYEQLPADWQAELRRLVGIYEKKATILAQPGVHDYWLAFAIEDQDYEDGYFRSTADCRSYFAYGLTSGQTVVLHNNIPQGAYASLVEYFKVGQVYTGFMYLYPGISSPKRALFKPDNMTIDDFEAKGAGEGIDLRQTIAALGGSLFRESESNYICTFEQLLEQCKQHFLSNPFASDFFGLVHEVRFAFERVERSIPDSADRRTVAYNFNLYLVDKQDQAVLINQGQYSGFNWASMVAGQTCSAFVRFHADKMCILLVVADGLYNNLITEYILKVSFKYRHFFKDEGSLDQLEQNLVAQAKVGTLNKVLDTSLFDAELQKFVQAYISSDAESDQAFLQMLSVAMPVLLVKDIKACKSLSTEQVINADKSYPGIYQLFLNEFKPKPDVAPAIEAALQDPAVSQLLQPRAIVPILPLYHDALPYFPDDLLEIFQEHEQMFSRNDWIGNDYQFKYFLTRFMLQQLLTLGRLFSPQQSYWLFDNHKLGLALCEESYVHDRIINCNSDLINFLCNPYHLDDMLFQLGGENLKFRVLFLLEENRLYDGRLIDKLQVFQPNGVNYRALITFGYRGGVAELARIREFDPAFSRNWMEANFDQVNQNLKGFMRVFNIDLTQDDEELLNTYFKRIKNGEKRDAVVSVMRYIPHSKYSVKCQELCKQYVKFNTEQDEWEIAECEHNRKFSLLGITKEHFNTSVTGICNLIAGMSWEQIKELSGTEDAAEALRRWAKFPEIAQSSQAGKLLVKILSRKIERAGAAQDAALAVQHLELVDMGMTPFSVLNIEQRKTLLRVCKDRLGEVKISTNLFLARKIQDGCLKVNLLESDDLLKFMLEEDFDVDLLKLVHMGTACLPWIKEYLAVVQEKIDLLSANKEVEVLYSDVYRKCQWYIKRKEMLEELMMLLNFKLKVESFVAKVKASE